MTELPKYTTGMASNLEDLSSCGITEEHEDKLLTNYCSIVEKLKNLDEVVDFLLDTHTLDKDMVQSVLNSSRTGNDCVRELLNRLMKGSEKGYVDFVYALRETQDTPELYELLKDENMSELYPEHFLFGVAKKYHVKLTEFHKQKLSKEKLSKERERHNPVGYITLKLHPKDTTDKLLAERKGFRENFLEGDIATIKTVQQEDLFKADSELDETEDPKTVLLVGPPGVGKTATLYYFLLRLTEQKLWAGDFDFVIFIKFRDSNHIDTQVSFQDLLFNTFGPAMDSDSEDTKAWSYILRNQPRLLFLLDGFDESNIDFQQVHTNLRKSTKANVLLQNLLERNLLPNARILISSRTHSLETLSSQVQRTVELGGLTRDNIKELINQKLADKPKLASSVYKYISSHENILTLCSIPVNIIGLLDYVSYQSRHETLDEIISHHLPQSRAHLMLLLIANILLNHDRGAESTKRLTTKLIFRKKAEVIRKLCKLAASGLFTQAEVKQVFSEEDLEEVELTADQVTDSGLLTGHVTSIADDFEDVVQLLLEFPHLLYEETFAALDRIMDNTSQWKEMIAENTGSHDMVLQVMLGLYGDPRCGELLQCFNPHINANCYSKMAEELLDAILSSKRRYHTDGELFCISCMSESLQYQFSSKVVEHQVSPLNTMNISSTNVTLGYSTAVSQFLDHIPFSHSLEHLVLRTSVEAKELQPLLSSKGYKGLALLTELTSDKFSDISKAINSTTSMKYLDLRGFADSPVEPSALEGFQITDNSTLECLHLGYILTDPKCLMMITESLQQLKSLVALDVFNNDLSKMKDSDTSPLEPLRSLSGLKYLKLARCKLSADDMHTVSGILVTLQLQYLDISNNYIGDEGADAIAQKLGESQLESLIIYKCGLKEHGLRSVCENVKGHGTIKHLNVGSNPLEVVQSEENPFLKLNTMEEVLVSDCMPDINTQQVFLKKVLGSASKVTYLDIAFTDLSDAYTLDLISQALAANPSLVALCLERTNLGDEEMKTLLPGLISNDNLQELDISDNRGLTDTTLTEVILRSNVKHLAIHDCDIGLDGWSAVAGALVHRPNLVTVQVGDRSKVTDLTLFLAKMQGYPSDGPLTNILICGERVPLAEGLCSLREALPSHVHIGFARGPTPFYIMSDTWQQHIPKDLRLWLMRAHFAIQ